VIPGRGHPSDLGLNPGLDYKAHGIAATVAAAAAAGTPMADCPAKIAAQRLKQSLICKAEAMADILITSIGFAERAPSRI
jgi:hypothetical protein